MLPLSGDPPPHLITTASRVSCTGIYRSYFTCDSCRRIVRPCSHASAPGMILAATRSDLCSSPISLHLTSHTLPVTSPFFISKNKMIGLHVVTFRNWFVHLFQPWSYGLSVVAFPSQEECVLDTSSVLDVMLSEVQMHHGGHYFWSFLPNVSSEKQINGLFNKYSLIAVLSFTRVSNYMVDIL